MEIQVIPLERLRLAVKPNAVGSPLRSPPWRILTRIGRESGINIFSGHHTLPEPFPE